MNKDAVILFSSSRSDGYTKKALNALFEEYRLPLIDLKDKNISFFDYESKNRNDDFIPLVEELVKYKTIISSSPTYWYSMCAQMKTFFDRISDLYSFRKDLLESLKGKNVFVVTSFGSTKPTCFEDPFKLTATYLQMNYHACHFDYSGNKEGLLQENQRNREIFLADFNSILSN
jgi:multimeric flavodoxin WrbA